MIKLISRLKENYKERVNTKKYNLLLKEIDKDPNYIKRNITFIRKKADFSKSKYLTILSKIPAAELNNEFLLRNILELCY